MLTIESLTVGYGSRSVLQEVSLTVQPGEIVALIGPNGAGKTTLFRAISGVLRPSSGHVYAFSQEISHLPSDRRARLLAVVPQARRLPAGYTVRQTVLIGRTPYLGWLGKPSQVDLQSTTWALERAGLAELAERQVEQLSGGEQQLVLLGRALAQDAPILLLDEPTAHLDLHNQSSLLNLVRALATEQGLAILLALHDLNLVSLYADRVALLDGGRLRALGSPPEVLTAHHLETVYRVPLHIIDHPVYGTPLILLDGQKGEQASLKPGP